MDYEDQLYKQKEETYYNQGRNEMVAFVPSDARFVLDVGCSGGGFGKLLKEQRHCEVWGIEPTDAALEASKHLDKVYHDYFHAGLDLGTRPFDAVIFNDVLEHLSNPWEALLMARTKLQDRGYVVASIPNVQCYSVVKPLIFDGNWEYQRSGIMDKTHLRFFTAKSIRKLFEDTGFSILSMEGQNSILKGSRLLRVLHAMAPQKIAPFTFVNYAVCAQVIK